MAILDNADIVSYGLKYINPSPRRGGVVREGLVLTGSPVETDYFDMSNYSFASLWFDLTRGSITDLRWKVWHSLDGTNWFQRIAEEVTLTDIENAAPFESMAVIGDFKRIKVVPVLGRFLKLEVYAVGTVTGSSLEVTILGV